MKQNNRKIWKLRREVESIHFTYCVKQTNGTVSNDNEQKEIRTSSLLTAVESHPNVFLFQMMDTIDKDIQIQIITVE